MIIATSNSCQIAEACSAIGSAVIRFRDALVGETEDDDAQDARRPGADSSTTDEDIPCMASAKASLSLSRLAGLR